MCTSNVQVWPIGRVQHGSLRVLQYPGILCVFWLFSVEGTSLTKSRHQLAARLLNIVSNIIKPTKKNKNCGKGCILIWLLGNADVGVWELDPVRTQILKKLSLQVISHSQTVKDSWKTNPDLGRTSKLYTERSHAGNRTCNFLTVGQRRKPSQHYVEVVSECRCPLWHHNCMRGSLEGQQEKPPSSQSAPNVNHSLGGYEAFQAVSSPTWREVEAGEGLGGLDKCQSGESERNPAVLLSQDGMVACGGQIIHILGL